MVGRRQNEFFFGRAKKSRCIRKCRAEQAGDLSEYLWARGSADLSVFDRHRLSGFSLVAVSKLEWNHDMVPWDIPPIFKNGASYTSGADEYLHLLINQIIPKAESLLQGTPPGGELRDIHWPDCLHCILFIRRTPFCELRVSPARCGFRELKSISFPVHP